MAHQRTQSSVTAGDQAKEPHPISLKVLRLSRPTLATQHPLPGPTTALSSLISPTASVTHPSSATTSNSFIISPLLTLPPSFGNAYVGETFSCTLCANNELPPQTQPASQAASSDPLQNPSSPPPAEASKEISNVRIEAEMKTPSMTVPLDVSFTDTHEANPTSQPLTTSESVISASKTGFDLLPSSSLQGIITFHLREEGSHVLAVTVHYNERTATSGRLRTFRKLYQFVARPCLVVRTKITSFVPHTAPGRKEERAGQWALEAQLENVGEDAIVLQSVGLETKEWCMAHSLNWDANSQKGGADGGIEETNPILMNGDVQQVCFLVMQRDGETGEKMMDVDAAGRLIVGMLNISWRGAMGNWGSLSTGWLGVKM